MTLRLFEIGRPGGHHRVLRDGTVARFGAERPPEVIAMRPRGSAAVRRPRAGAVAVLEGLGTVAAG